MKLLSRSSRYVGNGKVEGACRFGSVPTRAACAGMQMGISTRARKMGATASLCPARTQPSTRLDRRSQGKCLMDRNQLRTVLYVDDEPDIREIVEMALGLIGNLAVSTCASGEQALKVIPTLKPDLVLLDVMMPAMDGPTALSRMRADTTLPMIPVIFVTAKAMPQEIAHFRKLGAAGVIAKPFDPMDLGKQVLMAWEGISHQ